MNGRKLERDLRGELRGEVRFDRGTRAIYATDASNYRQVPIGVVVPRSTHEVERAIEICRAHDVPILPRGAGTSLAGQCCNVAVILDCSKYLDRIVEVDPARRLARVEPGVRLDQLRAATRVHGLTFGPDPATHSWCTFGGMIGNNACGVHSLTSGRTSDNVHELEVLTYGGLRLRVGPGSPEPADPRALELQQRLVELGQEHASEIRRRFPPIPRRVSGYNLDELLAGEDLNVARALVGTEGTCVTVLEAVVRLVPDPPHRTLLVLGYRDVYEAADHVPRILEHAPHGLEGLDHTVLTSLERQEQQQRRESLFPEGEAWLLVEFAGHDAAEADGRARSLMSALERSPPPRPTARLHRDPLLAAQVWAVREAGVGTTARIPGRRATWPGWEDAAVHPAALGAYLRGFRALLDRHGYHASIYGHFGQGCVHCRIDFELGERAGIERFTRFIDEAADLVLLHGGSFSGEHGDGQARAALLPRMFGDELVGAMREFKRLWDPRLRMNPGKVVDPEPPGRHLRLAVTNPGWASETHFRYAEDQGSFPLATLRCVGVGRCRSREDAFMCPSFLATHDEEHSTRGRARLLHEMTLGRVIEQGWRDEAVWRALDLCLGCKGCKRECPAQVDMATYRSEFLAHYYRGRLRPLHMYLTGHVGLWAKVASQAPRLANAALRSRRFGRLARRAAGLGPRPLPAFADETFSSWVLRQPPVPRRGRPVVLWPDVFTDHFRPGALVAARALLHRLGFAVEVARRPVQDPRALIHHGWLDLAKRQLRTALRWLEPWVAERVPIVALEPSVVSVFRDELLGLLADEPQARAAAPLFSTLSELLADEPLELARRPERLLLHVHCHEKAVLSATATRTLLERMGVTIEEPEPGCCGMAGAFGFEAAHAGLSRSLGERLLLPAVRGAAVATPIVADGFSCREQIEQGTGRRALHVAELLEASVRDTS